jgi:hypothetical protein
MNDAPRPSATDTIEDALDRGELVRLLADVDAGRIALPDLEAAVSRRERRWRFWRALAVFFGG